MDQNFDNIQLNIRDHKFLASVKLSVFRALIGEVNPSMRSICARWMPGDRNVKLLIIHDGIITDAIQSHYSLLMAVVEGDCWKYMGQVIGCDFDIVRLDFPKSLPKTGYTTVIYQRREPFIDPL